MTLDKTISVPNPSQPFAYDLRERLNLSAFLAQNSRKHTITEDQPYKLDRDQFILGQTRESIGLPITPNQPCLAARIEGKSSRARLGLLVQFTAPTVHAGWNGQLALEIINLGAAPILLSPGVPIAQLIVEQVYGTPVENPSQFQDQTTPEGL